MAQTNWKRVAGAGNETRGYTSDRGRLTKVGGSWILTARGGARYNLGKKASFPSAEAALSGKPMKGTKVMQGRAVKVARKVNTRSRFQRGTAYEFTRRGGVKAAGGRQG